MRRKSILVMAVIPISVAYLARAQERLTGCIAEDKEIGSFVLSKTSGEQIPVSGPLDLRDHVGHRVELYGEFVEERQSFRPTKVTLISKDCKDRARGLTADDQGMGKEDTKITQKIRQAITGDESLSTLAHNIKIITRNGLVTLRGPVRSVQEKKSIEAKATAVAGSGKVQSELTVRRANPDQ